MERIRGKQFQMALVTMMMLILIASLAVACDDDDDGVTVTVTETATATAAATSTTTSDEPIPSDEPVKIGIVQAWSGAMAMSGWLSDGVSSLYEWYVNKQGGIPVGNELRPVEFVKCDNGSQVAGASACVAKLITDDHVSVIAEGGATGAEMTAVASAADREKFPYVAMAASKVMIEDYDTTILTLSTHERRAEVFADFIINTLKPDTVYFLGENEAASRVQWDSLKPYLVDAGVEILGDEFVAPGTGDLAPQITKFKSEAPDLLFSYLTATPYVALYKQIEELGGWEDIQHLAGSEHTNTESIAAMPSALGSYTIAAYLPGSDEPGVVEFEQAWAERAAEDSQWAKTYGSKPLATHCYYWNCYAITADALKIAGSDDPSDILAVLRSGNLEAETPFGDVHILEDGSAALQDHIMKITSGGKLLLVQ